MALTKATNRMTTGAQVNIKDFESLKVGINWQPAIQAAIDSLDTGDDTTTGGVVYFPVGRYYIESPIIVRTTHSTGLASITLQGEGLHNTVIDCASGFSGSQAILVEDSTYCTFKDFHVLVNSRANYGLELKGGNEITIERVFCQNAITSCFYVHRCFMVTMNQCRAKGGVTQFDFGGAYNTSLNIMNCYASRSESNRGIGQGFLIRYVAYSTFTACGADFTGRWGYRVSNTLGVTFNNCGAEKTERAAWYFEASPALDSATDADGGNTIVDHCRCVLNGCVSSIADTNNASTAGALVSNGYGAIYSNNVAALAGETLSSIDVEINRFNEIGDPDLDSIYSVASTGVDTNHKVSLNGCKLTGAIISTVAVVDPIDVTRVNNLPVTGANTPVVDLANVFGSSNNYSGILNILATNGVPTSGSAYNSAAYVLLVTKSAGSATIVEIAKNGLTTGGGGSHPSFTWTLDSTNNELEASPVGSTSGNFYFYIGQLGSLSPS